MVARGQGLVLAPSLLELDNTRSKEQPSNPRDGEGCVRLRTPLWVQPHQALVTAGGVALAGIGLRKVHGLAHVAQLSHNSARGEHASIRSRERRLAAHHGLPLAPSWWAPEPGQDRPDILQRSPLHGA